MLFLMARLWPVVYYLFPGLLLGFGLAVLPHREQLGRELPPPGVGCSGRCRSEP